ncbi:hypothetical protein FK85_01420 [Halorubrum saccharovorum]|uniref:Response regulatory domain-containing protein n=1 Tax=Halorubrum saccharovorum TaxID=2248 RepID=A0A081EVR5_9EURY|nr:hypothetical protein FK85_01420 [Halorubrum saccharovorum]
MLHVDDEPEFAELVSIDLERDGEALEVVTETSVEAGLDRIETEAVDCIVTDYSTKVTDGGFGMASVRQLVLAHGWEITAAEGEAGGARFEVTDADIEPEGGVALPADE